MTYLFTQKFNFCVIKMTSYAAKPLLPLDATHHVLDFLAIFYYF